jgi:twitching motility two-component system response regulator PilH
MPIQKALVIDDSKTELMYMTGLLQSMGLEVHTAQNAGEAMQRLGEERPDVIFMDVVMPGKSGFQLTRNLRRSSDYADIPIIICSTKSEEIDKIWGLRQGARAYLTKPVSPAALRDQLKALS